MENKEFTTLLEQSQNQIGKCQEETRLIYLTCQYMTTHLPGLELFTLPDHLSSPPPIPRF